MATGTLGHLKQKAAEFKPLRALCLATEVPEDTEFLFGMANVVIDADAESAADYQAYFDLATARCVDLAMLFARERESGGSAEKSQPADTDRVIELEEQLASKEGLITTLEQQLLRLTEQVTSL